MIDTAHIEFGIVVVEGVLALGAAWIAFRYREEREQARAKCIELREARDNLGQIADEAQQTINSIRQRADADRNLVHELGKILADTQAELSRIATAEARAKAEHRAHMRAIGRAGNLSPKRHRKPAVMQGDTVN